MPPPLTPEQLKLRVFELSSASNDGLNTKTKLYAIKNNFNDTFKFYGKYIDKYKNPTNVIQGMGAINDTMYIYEHDELNYTYYNEPNYDSSQMYIATEIYLQHFKPDQSKIYIATFNDGLGNLKTLHILNIQKHPSSLVVYIVNATKNAYFVNVDGTEVPHPKGGKRIKTCRNKKPRTSRKCKKSKK